MIKLDISQAVFLYLVFTVVSVLILWVFLEYGKKEIKLKDDSEYVKRCAICSYTYIDSEMGNLSKCPQCGSYNKNA